MKKNKKVKKDSVIRAFGSSKYWDSKGNYIIQRRNRLNKPR